MSRAKRVFYPAVQRLGVARRQNLPGAIAQMSRNEQIDGVLTDRFRAKPSEGTLRFFVPLENGSRLVDRHDRVECMLDEPPQPELGLDECIIPRRIGLFAAQTCRYVTKLEWMPPS